MLDCSAPFGVLRAVHRTNKVILTSEWMPLQRAICDIKFHGNVLVVFLKTILPQPWQLCLCNVQGVTLKRSLRKFVDILSSSDILRKKNVPSTFYLFW